MPVARYFLFVGGVLLALLFVFDAYAPKLPVADRVEAAMDLPVIRIHSQRKWPEPIVFDTNRPTIVPTVVAAATVDAVVSVPAVAADVPAKVRGRAAFAQLEPDYPKSEPPKPRSKRKIAKSRVSQPKVLVAQQPRFGFFANNTW